MVTLSLQGRTSKIDGSPAGRSGFMTHAESEQSIRLFAQEVLPRLREIKPVTVDKLDAVLAIVIRILKG